MSSLLVVLFIIILLAQVIIVIIGSLYHNDSKNFISGKEYRSSDYIHNFFSLQPHRVLQEPARYDEFLVCKHQWSQNDIDSAIVTFITPSMGRRTLSRTVESVIAQSDPRWLMIIYLDGVLSSPMYLNKTNNIPIFLSTPSDRRICVRYDMKLGSSNCAGDIRNRAINESLTKWVAFVDDDDTISSRYVSVLASEDSMTPNASAIIFRMSFGGVVRPQFGLDNFYLKDVGISFSLRRSLFSEQGRVFVPSPFEDYMYLDDLRRSNLTVVLSGEILYFVRDSRFNESLSQSDRILVAPIIGENGSHIAWNNKKKKLESVQVPASHSCKHPSAGTLQFVFPERENVFFSNNIRGLNESIERARLRGCIGSWSQTFKIGVFLMGNVPVFPNSLYIQVQMEQSGSRHFSPRYLSKLSHATQVWEFSPVQSSFVHPENSYFVPTSLMLDSNPFYQCNRTNAQHHSTIFRAYFQGVYHVCEFLKMGLIVPRGVPIVSSSRNISSSTSINASIQLRGSNESDSNATSPSKPSYCFTLTGKSFDVLVFGALQRSYNNSREQLCDRLVDAGISVACLEGVFRDALNHFVCHSKIIVSDHFYEHSALETHRFDPLLQAGKIVITTPSSSPSLEALYHPHLIIAEREKIVSVVQDVLSNYSSIQADHEVKAKAFMRERMMNLDPLCAALQSLKADVLSSIKKIRARQQIKKTQQSTTPTAI